MNKSHVVGLGRAVARNGKTVWMWRKGEKYSPETEMLSLFRWTLGAASARLAPPCSPTAIQIDRFADGPPAPTAYSLCLTFIFLGTPTVLVYA